MRPEVLKIEFKQNMGRGDTIDLYIYSEVAPDGYDWWTGQKVQSETSQSYFRDKLAEYPNAKFINLYINSPGGSVREGYGIYAQLKRHPAFVTAYTDGFCNSICSIIAMAADKVVMHINDVMGIHEMVQWCYGNAKDHRDIAAELDKLMEGNRKLYLARSGGKISEEKLIELLAAETYLTAQECLEYGFCDEIVEQQAQTDPAHVVQQMGGNFAAQVKYYRQLREDFAAAMDAVATMALPVTATAPAKPPLRPEQSDHGPAPGPTPPPDPPQETKPVVNIMQLFSSL